MIAGGGRETGRERDEWHTNLLQTDIILKSGLHLHWLSINCKTAVLLSLCTETKKITNFLELPGDNTDEHSKKENLKPLKISNRGLKK